MKKRARTPRFICRTVGPTDNAPPGNLCQEAIAVVAGQALPVRTLRALGAMVAVQQVHILSIMLRQNNLTGDFARALLAATPVNLRTDARRLCRASPDCNRRLARAVRRLTAAQQEAEPLRVRHDDNLLVLALAAGWARTWVRDEVIALWLASHRPAELAILKRIVDDADFAVAPRRHLKLPYQPDATMAGNRKGNARKKRHDRPDGTDRN